MNQPTVFVGHRKNADGTHDSICPRCYATIATEHDQDDLPAQEAEHVCKEADLLRIQHPKEWLEDHFGIQIQTPDGPFEIGKYGSKDQA